MKGQPRALYLLNFVSMWECFSFYGMRALLVLYIVKELHFDESQAFTLYAAYITLAELGGILGGIAADRWLGFHRAINWGGWTIIAGHLCLAASTGRLGLLVALMLIITGTALFRTNVPALLGTFYHKEDPRRDAGYTTYYAGMNLGGFLASIVCVLAAEWWGWHAGFGLAALGMLMGMGALTVGKNVIAQTSLQSSQTDRLPWRDVCRLAWGARQQLAILLYFVSFLVVFYACEEQLGSSLVLFADRFVDRTTALGDIPAAMLITLNPLTILLAGPVIARLLQKNPLEESKKIIISLTLLTSAFWILKLGSLFGTNGNAVALVYPVASIILIGLGELFIGPTVYAVASKSAPPELAGLSMSLVTVGFSLANLASGFLSGMMATTEETATLDVYASGFMLIGAVVMIPVILLLMMKPLRRVQS